MPGDHTVTGHFKARVIAPGYRAVPFSLWKTRQPAAGMIRLLRFTHRETMLEVRNRRAAAFSFIILFAVMLFAHGADAEDEPVFDMGPGITPPRVTRQVNPAYKPDAEGFRVTGTVIVGLVVSSKGEPADVHVVRSLGRGVDESAVEAVRQWQFEPARKGGQPVAVRVTVEIRFHSM